LRTRGFLQEYAVDGELHGFGMPTRRLNASTQFQADPVTTLTYRMEERGWFTDLDASATIRVPAGEFVRIVVHLQRGNVRVTDATQARVVSAGTLLLDLSTASGHVQRPDN
jgi:hypothetical protein